MEIEHLEAELKEHENKSQHRFETLHQAIKQSTPHVAATEQKMTEGTHIKNIVEPNPMGGMLPFLGGGYGGLGGAGAGAGAGLGAGLLGGVLGGALLGGRGGLFGREGGVVGEGCVTPSQLTAALAGVQDTQMNTAVLQGLGDIKAAVPLAEGQVQLALAGAQNALQNQASAYAISNIQGFANTNQAISTATAGIIAVGETVKDTVNSTAAATQLGIANLATSGLQNTYALSTAINNDGEKTRALIQSINETNLNRLLTVADLDRRDLVNRGHADGVAVNVTQTVNQAQAQAQAQQQQQQQTVLLNHLCAIVGGLQNAVATNSNMIIGNTGATTTGAQTANPVNVRT